MRKIIFWRKVYYSSIIGGIGLVIVDSIFDGIINLYVLIVLESITLGLLVISSVMKFMLGRK